ncbi:PA2169 family four-helix-bundle protein [Emticicia fluvialis]|uniref:PA2169 family four-helix-bundle protein n=1 Tax=Emticicia fluvialis TaxID=2974474 RepID=UPI00216670FB|nr:PA2169 family four-helix-bundle protein [Emticicia fluvialis]
METEKIARELNYLIIHNLDAQEAYIEAAGSAASKDLRDAMLDEAEKRGSYARELQREVKALGEEVAEDVSLVAMLNNVMQGVRGWFRKPTDVKLVEECRQGDDETIVAYDTVLQLGEKFMPSYIYNIIIKQRKEIGLTYQALIKYHEQQLAH